MMCKIVEYARELQVALPAKKNSGFKPHKHAG